MATVKSTRAMTASTDGTDANAVFNVDTVNGRVDLPNGNYLRMWSGNYASRTLQLNAGTVDLGVSSTSPDPGQAGTISGVNAVGIARITPAAARTACVLQAGTVDGQLLVVLNEAAASFTIQFDVSGTSNVADGTNNVIDGLQAKLFIWDATTSLWYSLTDTNAGALNSVQSATAPAITNGATITTAGVGVARVAPGSAVTGIILQAGTMPGQEVIVVNEAASANSVTMAASGTSNVADGTSSVIAGVNARKYVWDSSTSLWYPCK